MKNNMKERKKVPPEFKIIQVQDVDELKKIIIDFNDVFNPPLAERIADLNVYIKKLYDSAITYVVLLCDKCVGFISFYANDNTEHIAYLTQIAVKPTFHKNNIGTALLNKCIDISRKNGMLALRLEVIDSNIQAINFYSKNGFEFCGRASATSAYMIKKL